MSGLRVTRARLEAMSPDEAAALWLLAREESALQEVNLFEQWLEQSDANRSAWRRVNEAWDSFDSWQEDDTLAQELEAARSHSSGRSRAPYRATASLALVGSIALVATAWIMTRHSGPAEPNGTNTPVAAISSLAAFGAADFSTTAGRRAEIKLPDGSRVSLDADSAVDVAFAGARRDVRLLKGQALFEVSADKSRPFSVEAGGRVTTALGTRFNIRSDPKGVRITLLRGAVVVRPVTGNASPVNLQPGEQYIARQSGGIVQRADTSAAEAWQEGAVQFDDTPLAEAIAEVSRYTDRRLIIRDPGIARLRISGRFRAGDPDRFANTLAQIYPVRVVRRPDGTIEFVALTR